MWREAFRLVACCVALGFAGLAHADDAALKIGVQTSLSGSAAFAGRALLEAIQFAVDESNETGVGPKFAVEVFDDKSSTDAAVAAVRQAAASDVALVLGPASSNIALVTSPVYAQLGLVSIISTVHADELTRYPTTFRTVVSTGQIGEAHANYLAHVLGAKRVLVLYKNNGYGKPLAARFKDAAAALGISAEFRTFDDAAQRDAAAREIAGEADQAPLVLGMSYEDAVPVLTILRRAGYRERILGTATMARSSFVDLFANEPEEQRQRGWFTDGVYAVSPMILDSANAETLAFAGRYRIRTGHEPSWETVQAYDAARLAMTALRSIAAAGTTSGLPAEREAVRNWLAARNGAATAVPSLTGPIWFTDRSREQTVRMGRFHAGLYESAPLQIVSVPHPEPADLTSGAVFAVGPDRYARLQRVVATGVFINQISHIDLTKLTYGADFYFWLRYAREAGPGAADPANIDFQNMVSGKFDRDKPAEQAVLPDGTVYRLWRVQGEFRNDFDLHRYPFDRQVLRLPFFNARAATDRIVYVLDRRNAAVPGSQGPAPAGSYGPIAALATPNSADADTTAIASRDAFRELTQWVASGARELRDNLVTASALGDPRLVAVESYRELSGFLVTVDVQRRAIATLTKSLLPLLLMTAIMFASLYFPHGLVKEKITVAITAALSGAVLLSAINGQLGGIGYTVAVEYAFYAFFVLSLMCVVSVLVTERLRDAKRGHEAVRVERWTRMAYLVVVAGVLTGAFLFNAGDVG